MSTVLARPAGAVAPVEHRRSLVERLPRRFSRRGARTIVAADALCLAVAFGAGVSIAWYLAAAHPSLGGAAILAAALFGSYAFVRRYEQSLAVLPRDEIYFSVAHAAIALAIVAPALAVSDVTQRTQVAVALGIGFSGILVGFVRWAIRRTYGDDAVFARPRVAVVGHAPRAKEVADAIAGATDATVRAVNWFYDADPQRWIDRAVNGQNDAAYIVVTDDVDALQLNALAQAAERRGVVLTLASGSCSEAMSLSALTLGGRTVVRVGLPGAIASRRQQALKRAFDIAAGALGVLVAAPILACAALAIVVESGFPILYKQERVGRGNRRFWIYKLRTMRLDAERESGPTWVRRNDDRVTAVGRFLRATSIDELPQLVNVLRGEMSIVGPRPERPSFVEQFSAMMPRYAERLLVAPGLTACSHLYMPRGVGNEAMAERLEYDVFYMRNWSLAMDLALVMKTSCEVWLHRAP